MHLKIKAIGILLLFSLESILAQAAPPVAAPPVAAPPVAAPPVAAPPVAAPPVAAPPVAAPPVAAPPVAAPPVAAPPVATPPVAIPIVVIPPAAISRDSGSSVGTVCSKWSCVYASGIILAIYIVLLSLLPSGFLKGLKKSQAASEEARARLENNEISIINSFLEENNQDKKTTTLFLQDRLYRAIEYAIKRHDWYEEQRYRILQTLLAIITFATTIAAFNVKSGTLINGSYMWSLVIGSLIPLISLLRGFWLYNIELDADRPYRKISNIRFWFFKYNFPENDSIANVEEQRDKFANRLKENFNQTYAIREDIEQLFILQILQKHKSNSLACLRWLLAYTIVFLFIQLVILFFSVQ